MTTAIIGVETSEARLHGISSAAVSASCCPSGGVASSRPYRTETHADQQTDRSCGWANPCLVRAVHDALERCTPILHPPPPAAVALSRALGVVVRDVVLTARGLAAGRLVSHQPALGRVSLLEWLKENASSLGRAYANELDRHFRVRG
jgi:hypothetical protein